MPARLASWNRERFVAGGGDALLLYVVYGTIPADTAVSASAYRTKGVPDGIDLTRYDRATRPELPFTDAALWESAGTEEQGLLKKMRQAPECIVLRGEVKDPGNLDYLRDAIGIITHFLDHGGIAAADPQVLKLYEPATWRRELFDQQPPALSRHVAILVSEEGDGSKWFHTRGLRKFGRPDLSVHQVSPRDEEAAIEMLQRFIVLQTTGGRIPEGQEIRIAGLPPGLTCRHGGSMDDPDFNNVHVEIQRKHPNRMPKEGCAP